MNELAINLWLMPAVAVSAVAFLYSSVGHGGATGYLAVLALIGVAPDSARGTALPANCFVAGVAWWRFGRALRPSRIPAVGGGLCAVRLVGQDDKEIIKALDLTISA